MNKNAQGLGLILILLILVYGLFIPQLGFYWDDYAPMLVYLGGGLEAYLDLQNGAGRPVGGFLAGILWEIIGVNIMGWHVVNFTLWFTVAALFWWVLRIIFPQKQGLTLYMVLLFLVYPTYQLQAIPFAMIYAMFSIILFLISVGLSLNGVQRDNWFLITLSALLIPAYFASYEQLIAFESLRPILMLWVLSRRDGWRWDNVGKTVLYGLPLLFAFALALIWKFIIFEPSETYAAYNQIIYHDSLSGWLLTAKLSIGSLGRILLLDWIRLPLALGADPDIPGTIAIIFSLILLFYMWRNRSEASLPIKTGVSAAIVAAIALVIVMLPPILVGRITQDGFNSRFAFIATLAAAPILILSITSLLRHRPALMQVVLAALLLLGVWIQVSVNQIYAEDWELRRDLWWQMRWRAPEFEADTMIAFVDGDDLAFERLFTDYEIVGHSTLYYANPPVSGENIVIVGELSNPDHPKSGTAWTNQDFRDWPYDLNNLVVFGYDGGCLRTAQHGATIQSMDDPVFANLAAYHRSQQISDVPLNDAATSDYIELVSPEPARGWCFYYQQIQWALDHERFDAALALANTAMTLNLSPQPLQEVEWLPFIVTFIATDDLESAERLLLKVAFSQSARAQAVVCEVLEAPELRQLLPACGVRSP